MKIDRGIPSPGDFRCYPWRQMQVGDSFFVERPSKVVSAAASCFASRHPGYRFVTRKVRENGKSGTRCWRVPIDEQAHIRVCSGIPINSLRDVA